jgi:hypothetical protein
MSCRAPNAIGGYKPIIEGYRFYAQGKHVMESAVFSFTCSRTTAQYEDGFGDTLAVANLIYFFEQL